MMKYNGIPVDHEKMLQKQSEANVRSAELKAEIDGITGGVNIGANLHFCVQTVSVPRLQGLPVMKLTDKNQEAADDATMQMLKEHCEKEHPELVRLFEAVQEYRKWEKLRSTYVDGYLSINSAAGAHSSRPYAARHPDGAFRSQKSQYETVLVRPMTPLACETSSLPRKARSLCRWTFHRLN